MIWRLWYWVTGRDIYAEWWERELEQIEVRVRVALALPCSDFHPRGAECAHCNPRYVAGYTASPAFLNERLEYVRHLEEML